MDARTDHVTLNTPIRSLVGVRPEHANRLEQLGVVNVGRLLTHLPHRHEWIRAQSGIGDLEPGIIGSVVGEISATKVAGFGRKSRFQAVLVDETGRLDLVFFNQAFLAKKLHPGMTLRVQGKPALYGGGMQISNPSFSIIPDDELASLGSDQDDEYRPVYPATEGITSEQIRGIVARVLEPACGQIEDHLDDAFREKRALPALGRAYAMVHAPQSEDDVKSARRRLAYDELLLLQLGVHMKRAHLRQTLTAPSLERTPEIDERLQKRMPFALTDAQKRVVGEISRDLGLSVPMNRLVQGDVGSGKTVVALDAMLLAIAHGHQATLMAPTELLAEQHYLSIEEMLAGGAVRLALLTGSMSAQDREQTRARIASGDVDLVVGTHAIVSQGVAFNSLAIAVIDEQHRFGVQQRAQFRVKGAGSDADSHETPHVLVMTATPIPRTIGLTIFGDLDISTIDGMPPGRSPIVTTHVPPDRRGAVYERVRARIEMGEQAFIVVPAIDTGASGSGNPLRDLRTVIADLEGGSLQGKKVAAMHGRLERSTREHIMGRFRAGLIDCLVATTVIEVGVDVPNATVMVIEEADRFGLAQLHQLRGRVGRGDKPGYCVLIADPTTDDGRLRLQAMVDTTSGFDLSERDLEIRGPGDVFGTRQSGMAPFRVADPLKDHELLQMARRDAGAWIVDSADLDRPQDILARRRLLKSHGRWLGIGDVG